MIVGILSDTHDHLENLKKALAVFAARNAEHLLHAGDFTSPFTWRILGSYAGGITAIFGNNDGDKVLLKKMYGEMVHPQPHIFTLGERKIVMVHEPAVVESLAASGHYDLVIYGHTHEPGVRKVGKTLVVNPGEVCGWLYDKPTVAVADLATMEAEIIPL